MSDFQIDPERGSEGASATAHESPPVAELGLAVTRILKTPLASLRASMESLQRNLDAADPRRETLSGALAEVARLARDVETLASYAAPRPLMPLACSLEEVLQGAVAKLAPRDAARVTVARPARAPELWVDGPVLSLALAHVVRVALESSGDDVLLEARIEAGRATFSVHSAGDGARIDALRAPRSPSDASLGLGLELARRDVARMRGSFDAGASASQRLCVRVGLPLPAPGRNG